MSTIRLLSLFGCFALLFPACDGGTTTGLKSDPFHAGIHNLVADSTAAIHHPSCVWKGTATWATDKAIFHFDGKKVGLILIDSGYRFTNYPSGRFLFCGESLVWKEESVLDPSSTDSLGKERIVLFQHGKKHIIAEATFPAGLGFVTNSGDVVAWEAYQGTLDRLFMNKGGQKTEMPIPEGYFLQGLATDGERMIWATDSMHDDIHMKGSLMLLDGAGIRALPDSHGVWRNITFSQGHGAWAAQERGAIDNEYVLRLLGDKQITTLTSKMEGSDFGMDGGKLVWSEFDGPDLDIFLWDNGDKIQLTRNDYADSNPAIDGDDIVWQGNPDGKPEIMHYRDGKTTRITDNQMFERFVKLTQGRIFWSVFPGNAYYTAPVP